MHTTEALVMPEFIGEYKCVETLGRGGFSKVFKAIHRSTGLGVAIKMIAKELFPRDKLDRELEIMKQLDHPFCCSFYEFIEDDNFYYLVLELVEGGSLFTLLSQFGVPPEWRIRHFFVELVSAVDYLHTELHLAHRDLKLENVIIDRYGNIRLIDYGMGNAIRGDECLQTACGSPAYAPPEMMKGRPYGLAADIWSAGVVLYALAVGQLPFEDKNINKMVLKIVQEEPAYPESMSPMLADLIRRMLIKDPKFRIRVEKIKEHPWFQMAPTPEVWGAQFGLAQGFRHIGFVPNPVVLQVLRKGGIDADAALEAMREQSFDARAAPYRIVHKSLVTDAMSGLSEKAEVAAKSEQSLTPQRGLRPSRKSAGAFVIKSLVVRRNGMSSRGPSGLGGTPNHAAGARPVLLRQSPVSTRNGTRSDIFDLSPS